MQLDRLVNQKE